MEVDDSEMSSQGSKASSEVLQDSETEVFVNCRVCTEPILVDNVREYTACTVPIGNAHFAAHFVCLGLHPKDSTERMTIKAATKCPRHSPRPV